jgi:protein MpaA
VPADDAVSGGVITTAGDNAILVERGEVARLETDRLLKLALLLVVVACAVQDAIGSAQALTSDSTTARLAGEVGTRAILLGRSEGGRPIVVVRAGDRRGLPLLLVGCIHGNEPAGIAIARALERARTRADLWIVPNLNPDGYARDTRQDARGVDLNANWSSEWHGGGRPWDVYYAGPRPFSERETRVARNLILRLRPRLTIWYHQHLNLVWAWGPSTAAGRSYARAAGMRFYHHHWLDGTATNWQNHHLSGSSSFTVELPGGALSPQQLRRQVSAVLRLAGALAGGPQP